MKILIINLRPVRDVAQLEALLSNLRSRFKGAEVGICVNKNDEALVSQALKADIFHIYDSASVKDLGFFKRVLFELKFIIALKKQKYDFAILPATSNKAVLLAKYAKIKAIVSFESSDAKINKFITHKVKGDGEFTELLKALN